MLSRQLSLFFFCLFFILSTASVYASSNVPKYEQTVKDLQTYFQTQDIDNLEKTCQAIVGPEVKTRHGLDYLITTLSLLTDDTDILDANGFDTLEKWVQAYPESACPYVFRTRFSREYAWVVRGNQYASKTDDQSLKKFGQILQSMVPDLEKAKQINPKIGEIWLNEGTVIMALNYGDKNLYYQDMVSYIGPYNYLANWALLNQLYPKWGGSWGAATDFVYSIFNNPDAPSTAKIHIVDYHKEYDRHHRMDSKYLARDNVWAEIEKAYRDVMNDYPNSAKWPKDFAEIAMRVDKNDIALEMVKKATALDADFAPGFERAVKLYREIDDFPSMVTAAERLVQLRPDDNLSHEFVAQGYFKQKNYKKAEKPLLRAVDIKPDSYYANSRLCIVYYNFKQGKTAEPYCRKAIELKPKTANSYWYLATILNIYGNHAEAQKTMQKYHELKK